MTLNLDDLRCEYPLKARVIAENFYNLPVGTVLPYARRLPGRENEIHARETFGFNYYLSAREAELLDDSATLTSALNQLEQTLRSVGLRVRPIYDSTCPDCAETSADEGRIVIEGEASIFELNRALKQLYAR